MTSTPSTTETEEESIFPTEWHLINVLTGMECRQLSDDTYQLRDLHNQMTINKEGFDLYRENISLYEKWIDDNSIEFYPRDPNGES